MDGGTIWNVNIRDAIEQCTAKGYAEEDIVMDIMICGYSNLTHINQTGNGFQNFMRKRDFHAYYVGMNSVVEWMKAYPRINYRNYVQQMYNKTSGLDEMHFDNATTWPLQIDGRETAKECLTTDSCKVNMQLLYEWA